MASRLIRDDMLDSERVQTLPIEARWLYVTMLLSADDVGLFEVNAFRLGRRASIDQLKVPVLVQCLADADLIRLYESDGKRFGFMPRFRQRLQIKRAKHPMPPTALMQDDEDALNKIKQLAANPPMDNGDPPNSTVAQPSEPELEPEEEKEELKLFVDTAVAVPTKYRRPACPSEALVELYHKHLPSLPAVEILSDGRKRTLSARWAQVCGESKFDRSAGLEWFSWFFARVATSKFLMGQTKGKNGNYFRCSFEFLLTPEKFVRVIEGFYHRENA